MCGQGVCARVRLADEQERIVPYDRSTNREKAQEAAAFRRRDPLHHLAAAHSCPGLFLVAFAALEIVVGAGLFTLSSVGIFDFAKLLPDVRVGATTITSGVINLVVALSGLWGAHNPRKITFFFWAVFVNALMSSWAVASAWSMGEYDPAALTSVLVALTYAVCAWNVRGQTGYFDNHPHPDDPDELPLERSERLLEGAREEGVRELEEGKRKVEEIREEGSELIEAAKRTFER